MNIFTHISKVIIFSKQSFGELTPNEIRTNHQKRPKLNHLIIKKDEPFATNDDCSFVPLFPQIGPEAASQELKVESQKSEYIELGVPEEWVEPLQKLGYTTIEKLKAVEKPGKLANDLNGYKKKNKLEIGTVTMEDVSGWLGK